MWQCVTVSATSERGQRFFWVFVWAAVGTDSVFGLTPGEIIWYQHLARGHQYEQESCAIAKMTARCALYK